MHIRVATDLDRENIRAIYLHAFPEGERLLVSSLAVNLLSERSSPAIISLVAENDGELAGHIAFSPVTSVDNEKWQGFILAPLGVRPKCQKRHIGSKLIKNGIQRLLASGVDALFVYGDPKYYSKFGFRIDSTVKYLPPYELQYPCGWQAIVFNKASFAKSPAKLSCVDS